MNDKELDIENVDSMIESIVNIIEGKNPTEVLIVLVRIIKIVYSHMGTTEPIEIFAERMKEGLMLDS